MKKMFLLILLLLTSVLLYGEEDGLNKLKVVGTPKRLMNEFVGNVYDATGDHCGLIKINSDIKEMAGFTYNSHIGVVKVNKNPGEHEIYVSPGEQVLYVFANGYEKLTLIFSDYGIQMRSNTVWEVKVTGDRRYGDIPVNIKVEPEGINARIELNGELITEQPVPVGESSHELRISAKGYKTVETKIDVSPKNNLFEFELEEVELLPVEIRSTPTGADIIIDGSPEGKTNRGVWRFTGTYNLELLKDGYLKIQEEIEVNESGDNTFSYELEKNSGTLRLEIEPVGASVFINKRDYGNQREIELAPGSYKIEIEKTGYGSASDLVEIERGKEVSRRYKLEAKTGKLQFSITPLDGKTTLKKDGRTVESWTGMKYIRELAVGEYTYESSYVGYETKEGKFKVEEGKTFKLDVKLEKGAVSGGSGSAPQGFVYVEGGSFEMGSTSGQSDEEPIHTVNLDGFYMSKYEVTQGEYERVMGTNPSYFKGSNRPVEKVSWYDAVEYCNNRSKLEGLEPCYTINKNSTDSNNNSRSDYDWLVSCNFSANGYRLPTEAEWEYAARGGNKSKGYKYSGSDDIEEVAWYWKNSGDKRLEGDWLSEYREDANALGKKIVDNNCQTHEVGGKNPNELGLYDMSGNVWEWCWDWYGDYGSNTVSNPKGSVSGSFRVIRGGCWLIYAERCRSAVRHFNTPSDGHSDLGFRLVRR